MEERYLLACTRYVELNPVRAGLVKKPEDWHWSSAGPHIKVQDDILVKTKPLIEMVNNPWEDFLAFDAQEPEIELFRKHERTGRPLGVDSFIGTMELLLGRKLKPQKPGPKKKISKVSPEFKGIEKRNNRYLKPLTKEEINIQKDKNIELMKKLYANA